MAYQQGGQVEAKDYNETLVGTPVPLANIAKQFNAIWGTGKGNIGYGQPDMFTAVAPGNAITSAEWNLLNRYIDRVRNWQGSSLPGWPGEPITLLPNVNPGTTILHSNGVYEKILQELHKYRIFHYLSGTGQANAITNTFSWTQKLTFTTNITFNTVDQARYFFNCGGQIAMSFSYNVLSSRPVINMVKKLATDIGTVYWTCSADNLATLIGSTEFTKVKKIGGGGNNPQILADVDYYTPSLLGATGDGVLLFRQYAQGAVTGYSNTNISIFASTSGPTGAFEGNGNVITLKLVLDLDTDILGGYTMPENTGTFFVSALEPGLPPNNFWSGTSGNLLFQRSWSTPSVSSTVLAI